MRSRAWRPRPGRCRSLSPGPRRRRPRRGPAGPRPARSPGRGPRRRGGPPTRRRPGPCTPSPGRMPRAAAGSRLAVFPRTPVSAWQEASASPKAAKLNRLLGWALAIADWTRKLPAQIRDETGRILLEAAAVTSPLSATLLVREGLRASRGPAQPVHRRRPGPVHPGRGLLRRDGDAAGQAGKRRQDARVREAKERQARAGKRSGGGALWFGYIRVYANPDEPVARKRVILREELHPVNAPALRDAAERVLRGESVGSVIRDWDSARHPAGRGAGVVAGVARRDADLAAHRGPAGVAGATSTRRPTGQRSSTSTPTSSW